MKAQKVVLILLVGFILYWMFSDPTSLAGAGESLAVTTWELLLRFFQAVIDFVGALG